MSSLTNGTIDNSKAEKLRKRQEQLAAWKQKKQLEETITTAPEPAGNLIPDADPKLLARQKRIEEWKKKRQQPTVPTPKVVAAPAAVKKHLAITTPIKKTTNSSVTKRKSAFDDDEDDEVESKPTFKAPKMNDAEKSNPIGKKNEIDELEIYFKSLEKSEEDETPRSGSNTFRDKDLDADSDAEELDEEDEQQKLLSMRLKKVQNKEKELAEVDHANIEYKPFRKSFYKESPEISKLSEEEVEAIRENSDGIKVRGSACPRPITKWSQLGLSLSVMSVIEGLKYTKPSPIQSQALPTIMSGRDVIGVAKTGSGKTLSFVLPLLRHIQDQPPLENDDGPIGLIMTPTRELALQIYKELTNFTKTNSITSSCCYGGSLIEGQIAELKKGVQIVVGTPGRLIDLLAANNGRVTNLRRVTYIVLDEADRMFDMGFEPQVTKVFSQVRPDRQTILFSATFPRKMELLAKKILTGAVEIIVGGISVVASEITQKVQLFEPSEELESNKFAKLLEILALYKKTKVLIFVEKQSAADTLLVKLLAAQYPCLAIHGGKEQLDRKYAIKEFSSANSGVNILIATSIAARGLDVKGLDLVINYEAASHMEDYVHRVGRTGRAGNKGTAITFVASNEERAVADLVRAMRMSKMPEEDIENSLVTISQKFLGMVKSGEEKLSFGFGGKGLEKLQQRRDNTRDLERQVYTSDKAELKLDKLSKWDNSRGTSTTASGTVTDSDIPAFEVIEGRAQETAGPDKCKFHSRITINDLPQRARWIMVNRDSLSKIIDLTRTSITNKGQFYAPGAKAPSEGAPPKLYLLVEGLTEKAVRDANNMLRAKMIEGLEAVAKDPVMPGKYSV